MRKLFGLGLPAGQFAELAIPLHNGVETAIEERIGNAGLLLHPVGEGDVGIVDGADIENEVGLEIEQHLEVRRVAAPGEAPDLGLVAGARTQQRTLRRLVAPSPSK
jgi:hypothetical protein